MSTRLPRMMAQLILPTLCEFPFISVATSAGESLKGSTSNFPMGIQVLCCLWAKAIPAVYVGWGVIGWNSVGKPV